MTNADKIRAMTDEQLAQFIAALLSNHRAMTIKSLQALGIAQNISLVEAPMLAAAGHLKWLKEPVSDGSIDWEA